MKEYPLISVIVPVYMTDRYTGACIESLINQTYKNLEIILVDDGSKDICPELCDLYASKDNRIIVIHKENGGLVSARKAAMSVAHGSLIGYVDGDDWIGPGYFQSMYESLEDSDADIVIAGFSRDLYGRSERMQNGISAGFYEGDSLNEFYRNMISCGDFFNHGITTYFWNKLFKRDVIEPFQMAVDNSFFVLEDGSAVFPAMLKAKKIVVTDNYAYHYRQREGSMLKTVSDLKNESIKLKSVDSFLRSALNNYSERYQLQKQIDDLMLSTFIVRYGGVAGIGSGNELNFIFNEKINNKRVVIYGAGSFGQQVQKRMKLSDSTQVVGWVDNDYWEYRRCCMNVDPISSVTDKDFDYIVIAGLASRAKKIAMSVLVDYGISPSKILAIDIDEKYRKQLLNQYLNN